MSKRRTLQGVMVAGVIVFVGGAVATTFDVQTLSFC